MKLTHWKDNDLKATHYWQLEMSPGEISSVVPIASIQNPDVQPDKISERLKILEALAFMIEREK